MLNQIILEENYMTFEDFVKEVEKNIKNYLPEKYKNEEIVIDNIKTSQGLYKGMYFSRKQNRIALTIDLEAVYQTLIIKKLDVKIILMDLATLIAYMLQEQLGLPDDIVEKIKDYNTVKNNLVIRFVSQIFNKELLKDIPFGQKEDLVFVYYIKIPVSDVDASEYILITNQLLQMYGITVNQLHADAMTSTMEQYPAKIEQLEDVLEDVLTTLMRNDQSGEGVDYIPSITMVSNTSYSHGAVTILYPGMLETLGETIGSDFYVIPSSIHEVLVYPDDKEPDRKKCLSQMVKEVNRNEVDPKDRLSDSLYHYNIKTKKFEIIAE